MNGFLGLDAGGTRTRALLVDDTGAVLGVGCAGPANWNNVGLDAAIAAWCTAADAAAQAAGGPGFRAKVAFLGAAGVKSQSDRRRLGQAMAAAGLGEFCECVNDTETALAGGLTGRPGIALIAGTGSFCLGRSADGQVQQCGGWGFAIDDVGSGFALGRDALRAVAFAADGRGPATALSAAVLARLGAPEPDALLACLYTERFRPEAVAALAPLVTQVAAANDAVALRILQSGADGLAQLVARVAEGLRLSDPELVVIGGAARSGAPYEPLIRAAIARAVPAVTIREPELPPAAGAVLRAMERAGLPVHAGVIAKLRASLGANSVFTC